MECCVCKCGAEDFKLMPTAGAPSEIVVKPAGADGEADIVEGSHEKKKEKCREELLPVAFEFFEDVRVRSSPPPTTMSGVGNDAETMVENVVLRIVNVPCNWVCFLPSFRLLRSN